MAHPEFLVLPVMMFADYFLTVWGAIEREKRYARHFKTEHYELNPVWQSEIARNKWFSRRFVVIAILLSSLIVATVELGTVAWEFLGMEEVWDRYIRGAFGAVIVLYGLVLGRHLSNLLLFRHLHRRPEEVSGEVVMSHEFVLRISLYQCLAITIPLAMIAVFSQSEFAWGGAVGIVFFLVVQSSWIRKAKRQRVSHRDGMEPPPETAD